jgi:hypothetical protein
VVEGEGGYGDFARGRVVGCGGLSSEVSFQSLLETIGNRANFSRYLDVNPSGYECPSHFLRSFPPLD